TRLLAPHPPPQTPGHRTPPAPPEPHHAGQGDADSLSARPRSHGGMPGRSTLLGVQSSPINGGGESTMPQRLASEGGSSRAVGGGEPLLLRHTLPRVVRCASPYGEAKAPPVADGGAY